MELGEEMLPRRSCSLMGRGGLSLTCCYLLCQVCGSFLTVEQEFRDEENIPAAPVLSLPQGWVNNLEGMSTWHVLFRRHGLSAGLSSLTKTAGTLACPPLYLQWVQLGRGRGPPGKPLGPAELSTAFRQLSARTWSKGWGKAAPASGQAVSLKGCWDRKKLYT